MSNNDTNVIRSELRGWKGGRGRGEVERGEGIFEQAQLSKQVKS